MRLNNNNYKKGYRFFRYPKPFIFIFLFFAIIYLLLPVKAVEISSHDKILRIFEVKNNTEIYIDYIHSVAKTPIRDVMVINDDLSFLLIRTEYSSFGAGLPTENLGTFEIKNGKYINSGIDKSLDSISLRVGRVANHKLLFDDGREFIFKDFLDGGDLALIKPVKVPKLLAIIH